MEKRGLTLCQINEIRRALAEKKVTDGYLVDEINEEAQNPAGTFNSAANLNLCQELSDREFKEASGLLERLVLGGHEKKSIEESTTIR